MREFCKRKTPEQRKRIVTAPFGLPLLSEGKLKGFAGPTEVLQLVDKQHVRRIRVRRPPYNGRR